MPQTISQLSKTISNKIIFIFITIFLLSITILAIIRVQINENQYIYAKKQVHVSDKIFAGSISEKFKVIADSDIFLEYIRSGYETRKLIYPDFLFEISSLKSPVFSGMSITDNNKDTLFMDGKKTSNYIIFRLCYMNGHLNPAWGECNYKWTLYLNKTEYINAFLKNSPDISSCSNCSDINLLDFSEFGDFPVVSATKISAKLTITNNNESYFFIYMIIISIILLLFYLWTNHLIRDLFSNFIKRPIETLTYKIKNNLDHTDDHYNLTELQYLSEQVTSWKDQQREVGEKYREIALGKQAVQVAHDIRSPLIALDMLLQDAYQLPEEKRIITRNAIGRIRDIANNLLVQYKSESNCSNQMENCLLTSVIDALITEKRIQFRANISVSIDFSPTEASYGLFCMMNISEFKRVLSNLINNSFEAIKTEGEIILTLEKVKNSAIITIIDNGSGIPKEILSKIGSDRNTFGKKSGIGLGLSHATINLKKWQGLLKVVNTSSSGTMISIELPLAQPPQWFLQSLKIPANSNILIIDDDATIHQVWKDRFGQLNLGSHNINLHNFSNKEQLIDWLSKNNSKSFIMLCDYEILGHHENGLDIIKSLSLEQSSILVTSRFDQAEIIENCIQMEIPLLPKNLASILPIHIIEDKSHLKNDIDLVLLDDDNLIHQAWLLSAKLKNKNILTFKNISQLLTKLDELPRTTPIYIDYSLNDKMDGLQAAKKLAILGYQELFLATGYTTLSIAKPDYIKEIVGKEFPAL